MAWSSSCVDGVWWLRVERWLLLLRAPWNEPLFSERYGYYALRVPLGWGWRVILRRFESRNSQAPVS